MKYLLSASLAFLLATSSNAQAPSKADVEAVGTLPQEYCGAWAQQDGHDLAMNMVEDVDFLTGARTYLHGRADFQTFHVRLLSGPFQGSTIDRPWAHSFPIDILYVDPYYSYRKSIGGIH